MTFVVATAGHVDHGKSTLIRALTGMEPDRLDEERRRGLSIELGYAWTTWPEVGDVAFVDVPGHRRFVRTTVAGLAPVPVVLLVVAADESWRPQSAEHLAALDALRVGHGVLVITKTDRADPARASAEARRALATTTLADLPEVRVCADDGSGIPELILVLTRVLAGLPVPDPAVPARLWVDRCFTVTGAGQVITGTLPAGTLRVGDELTTSNGAQVRVRAVESLGRPVDEVRGTARVAINVRVRGPSGRSEPIGRGQAVFAPGSYTVTTVVDGALRGASGLTSGNAVLHVGSAAVACRVRPLGDTHLRLTLSEPLPLHVGDRAVVRDPGRPGALVGLSVLDVSPPALSGRGAASRRADELAGLRTTADVADHLLSAGPRSTAELAAMGLPTDRGVAVLPGWRIAPGAHDRLARALFSAVGAAAHRDPLGPPPSLGSVAAQLGLPDPALVRPLAAAAGLRVEGGLVRPSGAETLLPAATEAALAQLDSWFELHPYEAPVVDQLDQLGLDDRAIIAAARIGRVLRLGPRLVLAVGADTSAHHALAELTGPFRVTDVCAALATTRRTAVPLLELLDRSGRTRRLPDGRRTVIPLVEV